MSVYSESFLKIFVPMGIFCAHRTWGVFVRFRGRKYSIFLKIGLRARKRLPGARHYPYNPEGGKIFALSLTVLEIFAKKLKIKSISPKF